MTETQDSSVLFALRELRKQEELRAKDEAAKKRELAEVARKQAETAARKRLEAERNAEEVLLLRRQVEQEASSRAELESQILRLRASQTSSVPHSASPEPMPVSPPKPARTYHLVWGTALLVSCLGVFVLTYSPEVAPEPIEVPVPVVVAQHDCPELLAVPSVASESHATENPRVEQNAPEKAVRTRSADSKKDRTPRGTQQIVISDDCNGPLCDLPD